MNVFTDENFTYKKGEFLMWVFGPPMSLTPFEFCSMHFKLPFAHAFMSNTCIHLKYLT